MTTTLPSLSEIRSYLDYYDYSLALRRILDLSMDSRQPALLQQAIELNRKFRALPATTELSHDASVHEAAIALLDQLAIALPNETSAPVQLLTATNIAKTYRKSKFSLAPLSLQLTSGEVLGVVGQNGHGKTTLLRCLAGQLALDAGSIRYHQLSAPDYYQIKHHVAFIPQRIPRWYGQLKDNLHFSAAISGVTGEENQRMVDFMLERLNLAPFAHLTWNEISSGYRTRFEIARILLQQPSVLILDEPLANLDINAQQTILTDLRYIARSSYQPMGVILSSQQLHEVEKVADTVLLISNGNCVFRTGDTPDRAAVVEVETTATREQLSDILGEDITIHFNGGFFTIHSDHMSAADIIQAIVSNKITVTYFRDITHSTKRYF